MANKGSNVFKTYLTSIYHSGPIQALIKHFSDAGINFQKSFLYLQFQDMISFMTIKINLCIQKKS